jgi:hypothetical protein
MKEFYLFLEIISNKSYNITGNNYKNIGGVCMKIFKKSLKLLSIIMIFAIISSNIFIPTIAQAKSIKINKKVAELNIGDKLQLKITGTSSKVTWSSDDEDTATVSKKGKVTAISGGEVVITGTVNKKDYDCYITVIEGDPSDAEVNTPSTTEPTTSTTFETPNFTSTMLDKTEKTEFIAIMIKNNGTKTMRITADSSYLINPEDESVSSSLVIVLPNQTTRTIDQLSYIDIPAGQAKAFAFQVVNGEVWYDTDCGVSYQVSYDGKTYMYCSNYSLGAFELKDN